VKAIINGVRNVKMHQWQLALAASAIDIIGVMVSVMK
jgi:hypothetical protein